MSLVELYVFVLHVHSRQVYFTYFILSLRCEFLVKTGHDKVQFDNGVACFVRGRKEEGRIKMKAVCRLCLQGNDNHDVPNRVLLFSRRACNTVPRLSSSN